MMAHRGSRARVEKNVRRCGGKKPGGHRQGIRVHCGAFPYDRGKFAANRAAAGFDAGSGRGVVGAAIVSSNSSGRLASAIRQKQCGYQDDSDSRAIKNALRHGISLAFPGWIEPVIPVTFHPSQGPSISAGVMFALVPTVMFRR